MRARTLFTAALAVALVSLATPARAQVHWDVGVQGGVMKRFLGDKPAGGDDAGFGPAAMLHAHLALYPLVRVGAYLGHDISPLGGDGAARDITSAGARVKIMSPWPRAPWRAWIFVGLGHTRVWARSYATTQSLPAAPGQPAVDRSVFVHGDAGGFFEVPLGMGVSYKFRKPWEMFWELGTRIGFGGAGPVYDEQPGRGRRLTSPGLPDAFALPSGQDNFAIGLTMGLQLDL
ncbi:MAG: hypothetical protein KF819_02280 [Labilithrix sp.]|nr:hypothetical protein [Labilithrix sp.]